MNSKTLVWVGATIGSFIGSFVPSLWGADMLSMSSLIFGSLGAVIGIYLGYKISK